MTREAERQNNSVKESLILIYSPLLLTNGAFYISLPICKDLQCLTRKPLKVISKHNTSTMEHTLIFWGYCAKIKSLYCYCKFDLCEVADLSTQFTFHSVNRALELNQLSIQKAGVVFVFRKFQNYIT